MALYVRLLLCGNNDDNDIDDEQVERDAQAERVLEVRLLLRGDDDDDQGVEEDVQADFHSKIV